MPFTFDDYKRLTGSDIPPAFYTTPPDPTKCKNFDPNSTAATPCWHPSCDCPQPKPAPEPVSLRNKIVAGIVIAVIVAGAIWMFKVRSARGDDCPYGVVSAGGIARCR